MPDCPDCLYLLRYFGYADKERMVDVVFCHCSKARKYGWRAALVTSDQEKRRVFSFWEQDQERSDYPGPREQNDACECTEVVSQYPHTVALRWFGKYLVAGGRFLGKNGQMSPIWLTDSGPDSPFKKKKKNPPFYMKPMYLFNVLFLSNLYDIA